MMQRDNPQGPISAIIVSMVNSTKDFDIRNIDDVQHVIDAINKIAPAYANAIASAQKQCDRDAYAD